MSAEFIVGDSLTVLKTLPNDSVQCVVTSPPYPGQRRYTDSSQEIGWGSLTEYIQDIVNISEEVRRILKPTGLYWLNVGDRATLSGGAGGDYNRGGSRAGRPKFGTFDTGLPGMSWCMTPARLVLALQEAGWLIRSWITWDKGQERREDLKHVRRPRPASEVILLLAKSRDYQINMDVLPETGDIWHFSPSRGSSGHQAPFPIELPKRCILASTQSGDTVLDPFVGSGTTLQAAAENDRNAIGIDLDPRNVALAQNRVGMWLTIKDMSDVQ